MVERKRGRLEIATLLLHYVERVAIEDTHEPGAKRAAALKARQPAPGQQKRTLRNLFSQRALVIETQSSSHRHSMMRFPELLERILVTPRRFCNQLILNGHYHIRPLFSSVDVLRRSEERRVGKEC